MANRSNTFSFFSLNITSGVITNSGASFENPVDAQSTYVNVYETAVQAQGSPADVTLGAAIKSAAPVTGSIMASPPTNVDVVVTLYGLGKVLGTYTLDAGQSSGDFSFPVSSGDAIPQNELEQALQKILPKPPRR
ncbi:MAG: hypothetical protein ACJ74H_08075 [Thermoanaerobaculia bacterium]